MIKDTLVGMFFLLIYLFSKARADLRSAKGVAYLVNGTVKDFVDCDEDERKLREEIAKVQLPMSFQSKLNTIMVALFLLIIYF